MSDGTADKGDPRSRYGAFARITSRWHDTDLYNHVNNVIFYSWVDTAVNGWLVEQGLLEIGRSRIVGFIVESGCRFYRPVAFPAEIHAGIRVARLGNSSVRYEIGIFANGDQRPSAEAFFVHVYVDAETHRPVPLPAPWRDRLTELVVESIEV